MTDSGRCQNLITQYLEWQSKKFNVEEGQDGSIFIATPFIRADGHAIEIEARFLGSGLVRFTDAGETLDELWMQGVSLTPSTLDEIGRIASRFRVKLSFDERILMNEGDGGALQLQDFASAIVAASSLIERRRMRRNGFAAEVRRAIWNEGVKYETPFQVSGRSKAHTVDLRIKGLRGILAQPMTAASESGAIQVSQRFRRSFEDILSFDDGWTCFSIIEDRGRRKGVWTERALELLAEVSTVISWDEGKDEFLQHLAERSATVASS
jgi:hypothetical protein